MLPNGTVNEAYRPLVISMYHLHVNRWLEVFPREQLLVVNGDQLIEDPVAQIKRIESFLGNWKQSIFLSTISAYTHLLHQHHISFPFSFLISLLRVGLI
jgi:Sulfotransferase domain